MNKKNILKVAIFAVLSIVIISMGTCLAAIKEPDSIQWSYITSTGVMLDKYAEYEDYDVLECAGNTSSSYGTTGYVKVELKYYKEEAEDNEGLFDQILNVLIEMPNCENIARFCKGINDVNNMGAVMAPACADTIYTYLQNAHETVKDYDLILTGDLGKVGLNILKEYYEKVYNERLNKIMDAGDEIFLETSQYSGGSGPVCLPLVFLTKILKNKKYKKILIVGSGSLHNPTLVNQGKEILAISHLVKIEVLL